MKKKVLMFLLACLMLLSLVVPAAAHSTDAGPIHPPVAPEYEPGTSDYAPIAPRNEMTRIYFRNLAGNLQFRVWGITSGRWLTEWQYL
ncbi:MAG: hypothetical protein FWE28_03345 [Oscillospiraceae bacterium]|nr:hypothetical protein [Oscillospiraceae bacterium]